jgi:uncharacterized protein YjiS (DUF1127 family)
MLISLIAAVRKYFLYRETVRELSTLTERQLNEIGISQYDIRRVARDAVYGPAAA